MAVTVAVAAAKLEGFDNGGSVLAFIMTLQCTPRAKACHDRKKEIEPDEQPARGTLWLKGRVNKDGEYPDDEIRSVGDKLKETKDKIKEGTLKVDHGTDAMTVVLGKEKGRLCKRSGKWSYIQEVSPVDINPINSSADEEGGTTIFFIQ
ncbi:hypothetical protein Tco_0396639 [Tanacetum coccineum]